MTKQTIRQLNQLNRAFYATVANDFSQTRNTSWTGWAQLAEPIQALEEKIDGELTVLDIGCGNGRFLSFLESLTARACKYLGVDNSEQLLHEAMDRPTRPLTTATYDTIDIVDALLNRAFEAHFSQDFHLIAAFGVLHHIPSHNLREAFFQACASLLKPNGLLVVTAWQFDRSFRLMQRALEPESQGIAATDLEVGDYLLDWQRGSQAVRYCHLTTGQELSSLITGAGLTIIDQFDADGHEGHLNKYLLLKR